MKYQVLPIVIIAGKKLPFFSRAKNKNPITN